MKEWGPVFATPNYEELIRSPNVDAVVISTPNNVHAEAALACLQASGCQLVGLVFLKEQSGWQTCYVRKTAWTKLF